MSKGSCKIWFGKLKNIELCCSFYVKRFIEVYVFKYLIYIRDEVLRNCRNFSRWGVVRGRGLLEGWVLRDIVCFIYGLEFFCFLIY